MQRLAISFARLSRRAAAGAAAVVLLAAAADAARADVAPLVRKVSPSVVMIEAVSGGRVTRGAGFVFGARGRIATVFHVVEAAQTVHLRFSDGRRTTARIAAHDGPFDLALLEPQAQPPGGPLPFAKTPPDSGAAVVAIGYPFGHAFTVTAGVVSGHDRTVEQQIPHGFLQHDAALNPGSSGGPLLTASGEVAGVNAAIPNGRRTDVGAGFAIPAEVALRVLGALETNGALAHGALGARLRQIDHELAAALGVAVSGALVEDIEPEGAAQRAGLRPGDVVARIGGREIGELRIVAQAVTGGAPGQKLLLEGRRNGAPLRIEVALAALASAPGMAFGKPDAAPRGETGMAFESAGNRIASVAAGSPAAAAGLKAGDSVLAVGEQTTADGAGVLAALQAQSPGSFALLVRREGLGARYVILNSRPQSFSTSPLEGNREAEGSIPF